MNLFASKSMRHRLKNSAALTLLAAALGVTGMAQAAPPEYYGMEYTWVEGGWSRHDDTKSGSHDHDGGYLRGSFALGDQFYLLGSYSQNKGTFSKSETVTVGGGWWSPPRHSTITAKYKTTITQGELGLGFHTPMAERVDFIAELTATYFGYDTKISVSDTAGIIKAGRYRLKDNHNYGGKGMLGLRARPFERIDVWGKIGYAKLYDGDDSTLSLRKAPLATLGAQLRVTEHFGLVAETDLYKKDLRYYRLGGRVIF